MTVNPGRDVQELFETISLGKMTILVMDARQTRRFRSGTKPPIVETGKNPHFWNGSKRPTFSNNDCQFCQSLKNKSSWREERLDIIIDNYQASYKYNNKIPMTLKTHYKSNLFMWNKHSYFSTRTRVKFKIFILFRKIVTEIFRRLHVRNVGQKRSCVETLYLNMLWLQYEGIAKRLRSMDATEM